ncbi:hypothetical protein BIS06_10425, partial [Halomonas sp. BBD48]|nr:hypothetical protein [Halomonas sp. BBD48]
MADGITVDAYWRNIKYICSIANIFASISSLMKLLTSEGLARINLRACMFPSQMIQGRASMPSQSMRYFPYGLCLALATLPATAAAEDALYSLKLTNDTFSAGGDEHY